MAIRAGIFFTAGLVLVLFPKQVVRMQRKVEPFLVNKLHLKFMRYYTKYSEEKCIRTSKNMSIFFFIIAIGLLIYSILN
jgi:hypothetical protein